MVQEILKKNKMYLKTVNLASGTASPYLSCTYFLIFGTDADLGAD